MRQRGFGMGYLLTAGLWITLLLRTGGAQATCIETCQFYLLDKDCRTPTLTGTWPSNAPLSFGVRCGYCCSAPGGPGNCVYEEVPEAAAMTIVPYDTVTYKEGPPVEGKFKKKMKKCEDIPVFEFDGKLAPGNYVLTVGERLMLNIIDTAGKPDALTFKPLAYYLAPPPEKEEPADAGTGGPPDAGAEPPATVPPAGHDGGCASCAVAAAGDAGSPSLFIAALLALLSACAMRGRRSRKDRP